MRNKKASPAPTPQTGYVHAAELAAACGVDLKSIHNWVDKGSIPGAFRTPGRHIRVPLKDAVAFLRGSGFTVPEDLAQRAGVVAPAPSAASAEVLVARAVEAVDALRAAFPRVTALDAVNLALRGLVPADLERTRAQAEETAAEG